MAAKEPGKVKAKRNLKPRPLFIAVTATDESGRPVPKKNITIIGATRDGTEIIDILENNPNATFLKHMPAKRATEASA